MPAWYIDFSIVSDGLSFSRSRIIIATISAMIHPNTRQGKGKDTAKSLIFGGFFSSEINADPSLGVLLWQIMKFMPLSADATAEGLTETFRKDTDQTIVELLQDCFDKQPQNR